MDDFLELADFGRSTGGDGRFELAAHERFDGANGGTSAKSAQ